jgi:hypothetical protein
LILISRKTKLERDKVKDNKHQSSKYPTISD